VFAVVQWEAARRYAGSPWGVETRLSLTLKPWWHLEVLTRLAPAAFDPPPRVQCALLWLARREAPLVDPSEARLYRDFVAAAFGRRGQRVRDGLRGLLTPRQQAQARRELPLDLEAPPSGLSFEQWLALFRVFAWHADPQARARVKGAEERLPRRHRPH
jgi:16S rRNA A1518/A1519 N6-dimethyltransferase RsmA/KsgA/DIM1 with predicted DNA glycosylase/AP lyase activity